MIRGSQVCKVCAITEPLFYIYNSSFDPRIYARRLQVFITGGAPIFIEK